MSDPVRVMVELGKKRAVASAFDWPGWDRSAKSEEEALVVLGTYRPRYARVAEVAGRANEFAATGEMAIVERLGGTGMTDFYGVSARAARPRTRADERRRVRTEDQPPPRLLDLLR